ncbi:hypothetical protein [Sulfitobacter sp. S190]|uniref:hypothetical protein n=1 Tax=Sulfitobacter sp. S190 TaxID=2867022 RepID=UPI0021A93149|nr:hypothetical protein [Sulfitobacter sp. S190]UWR20947.1 hypothetical protein K3756_09420 [Sulfitobacter sp. S190]
MKEAQLDDALIAAHAADDADALITLYTRAADGAQDEDRACFYLTHAMVFALEAGDARAQTLRARLVSCGREIAQSGVDMP